MMLICGTGMSCGFTENLFTSDSTDQVWSICPRIDQACAVTIQVEETDFIHELSLSISQFQEMKCSDWLSHSLYRFQNSFSSSAVFKPETCFISCSISILCCSKFQSVPMRIQTWKNDNIGRSSICLKVRYNSTYPCWCAIQRLEIMTCPVQMLEGYEKDPGSWNCLFIGRFRHNLLPDLQIC